MRGRPTCRGRAAHRRPQPDGRGARRPRGQGRRRGRRVRRRHVGPEALNPEWDTALLDVLASGDLERIDAWPNDWFVEQAGHSSHEVRTWIAAYAALGAAGRYEVETSFYEAIPEWIAGFGLTTARSLT
ncbi:hypothetical protein ACFQV8_40575 [Pseudonocardia benzenivorans]